MAIEEIILVIDRRGLTPTLACTEPPGFEDWFPIREGLIRSQPIQDAMTLRQLEVTVRFLDDGPVDTTPQ